MLFPLPGTPFPCGKLRLLPRSPSSQLHVLSDGHVLSEVLAILCHSREAGIGAISRMRKQRPKEGTCPGRGPTVERAEVGLGHTQVLSLTASPATPDGRGLWRGFAVWKASRHGSATSRPGLCLRLPPAKGSSVSRPSPRTGAEPWLPDIYPRTPVLILCSQPGRCQSDGRENWPPPPTSQPAGRRAGWGPRLGQSTASTLLSPAGRLWSGRGLVAGLSGPLEGCRVEVRGHLP